MQDTITLRVTCKKLVNLLAGYHDYDDGEDDTCKSKSAAVLLTTCAAVPCISCQCPPLPLQLKNRFSSENLPKQGFLPSNLSSLRSNPSP